MELDKLKDRLLEVLPKAVSTYEATSYIFKYYYSITGFINENYFNICLMEYDDKKTIKVSTHTVNPLEIVKLIKSIDKNAKVKYYEISYNEKIV